jgi:hypothetical protein
MIVKELIEEGEAVNDVLIDFDVVFPSSQHFGPGKATHEL